MSFNSTVCAHVNSKKISNSAADVNVNSINQLKNLKHTNEVIDFRLENERIKMNENNVKEIRIKFLSL